MTHLNEINRALARAQQGDMDALQALPYLIRAGGPAVQQQRGQAAAEDAPRFVRLAANGLPVQTTTPAGDWVAIHDRRTGLIWSRTLTDEGVDHRRAIEIAEGHRGLGHADWRAPTCDELLTLVDRDRCEPAIDTDFFPACASDWYWSSSLDADDEGFAWFVGFDLGGCSALPCGFSSARVRAVRGPVPRQ